MVRERGDGDQRLSRGRHHRVTALSHGIDTIAPSETFVHRTASHAMNKPVDLRLPAPFVESDDCNTSANTPFASVLAARMGRRGLLRRSLGTAGGALMGSLGLSACGGGDDETPAPAPAPSGAITSLAFAAVGKSLADTITVPAGYTASVLYRCGDPLVSTVAAAKNDGTDTDFDKRSGDCHDGIEYFGLNTAGTGPDASNSERGLLGMNHEYQNNLFLHASGPSANPRPAAEVDKEVAVHGLSIVEVRRSGSAISYVKDSAYNRRITAATEMLMSGPAAGDALLKTKYSIDGSRTRGTQNNCGTGTTPWGTLLTCEENWIGYFTRVSTDDTARGGATARSVVSLKRYGLSAGAASRYGWETGGTADLYARWNASLIGTSTDGTDKSGSVEVTVADETKPTPDHKSVKADTGDVTAGKTGTVTEPKDVAGWKSRSIIKQGKLGKAEIADGTLVYAAGDKTGDDSFVVQYTMADGTVIDVTYSVTVKAAETGKNDGDGKGDGVAKTGAAVGTLAGLGLMLLAVGVSVVMIRRKRSA